MAKKVTVNVHAHHKDRDETVYLEAGDEVPDGYVVGDHATQEVKEPEFVSVPGFGQVAVHELKRLKMGQNSGLSDAEKDAQKSADANARAAAKSAKERADAAKKAAAQSSPEAAGSAGQTGAAGSS